MMVLKYNFISKRFLILLLLLVSFQTNLYSQNTDSLSYITSKDSLDKKYGMDPSLYNGIMYQSVYPKDVKGDQSFSTPNFIKGEATIRGVYYKNIDLNFDIYKQELLLRFINAGNSYDIITISKAWLETFEIGNHQFKIYSFPEAPNRIYQTMGNGSILLLYFWKKDLKVDNVAGVLSFIPQRLKYVLMNKSLKKYRNNREFLHLFLQDKQLQIKKYMQQNRIKVNKSSDKIMEELINYCSKYNSM